MGRHEPTGARIRRAGERTLDVTEQLGLEQVARRWPSGLNATLYTPLVCPLRANSSLPVPVSPVIRMLQSVAATRRIVSSASTTAGDSPVISAAN
jgi:hypothetical protein